MGEFDTGNEFSTDLTIYMDALIADLKGKLPDNVHVVEYDPFDGGTVPTPSVLVGIEHSYIDETQDCGDGRTPLRLFVELSLILSDSIPRPEVTLASLAAHVKKLLRYNRFGLGGALNDAEQITGQPSAVKLKGKKSQAYHLWEIAYEQVVYLGDEPDSISNIVPVEVYLGEAPEIGLAHEDDYVKVYPDAQSQ